MAKHAEKKEEIYKTPSPFGSHSSMIDAELTAIHCAGDPTKVVCRDGKKEDVKNEAAIVQVVSGKKTTYPCSRSWYVTERKRLDDGSADPNRYKTCRINFDNS